MVDGGQQTDSAIWNGGYSHYEALQLQFQRRMSHGLQALVSYTLAKSSDLGSNDGTGFAAAPPTDIEWALRFQDC